MPGDDFWSNPNASAFGDRSRGPWSRRQRVAAWAIAAIVAVLAIANVLTHA